MNEQEQPTRKTRAQVKAARRAHRNDAQAKMRRRAAMQRRAAMAADRFEDMRANPFDPAWKMSV